MHDDAGRTDVEVILSAQADSGAILACPAYPTYRYAWLRDGAFCAAALDASGRSADAARFHGWVARRVLAFEEPMRRAIDAVARAQPLDETDHLPCRFTETGQAPTGDGWGAFQMDGPGLWLWALERHARAAGGPGMLDEESLWAAALAGEYLGALWRQPSYDAWEEHVEYLASSTLAACLSGLLAAHRLGLEPDHARVAVDGIRRELATRASRVGHLPRSDGDDAVDASILWCGPLMRVFAADDEAWIQTLAAVERSLLGPGGGVYRYASDTFYGGGQWPVLTAAHGLACLHRGGPRDGERVAASLEWIESRRDAAGGLPEQVSDHALHPQHVDAWVERWGPVARPLTWSHAMAVLLRAALAER